MAEIKISELSVGDWVEIDGRPKRISSVLETPMGGMVRCQGQSITAFVEHIHPIPLTHEILEKNGFVKSSEYRWSNPSIGCACLRLGTKYWDIRIVGRNRAYRPTRISIDNIVHTHQLQHALRLAGVEKDIKV